MSLGGTASGMNAAPEAWLPASQSSGRECRHGEGQSLHQSDPRNARDILMGGVRPRSGPGIWPWIWRRGGCLGACSWCHPRRQHPLRPLFHFCCAATFVGRRGDDLFRNQAMIWSFSTSPCPSSPFLQAHEPALHSFRHHQALEHRTVHSAVFQSRVRRQHAVALQLGGP